MISSLRVSPTSMGFAKRESSRSSLRRARAGVHQLAGRIEDRIVTSAGFFGKATTATLTVYAVAGTAPAVVTGNEKPISNVVRESFTIAG